MNTFCRFSNARSLVVFLAFALIGLPACGDAGSDVEAAPAKTPSTSTASAADNVPSAQEHIANLGPVLKPWTGDLPGMLDRRVIRALVPWSDSYYYLDGVIQKGIAFEAATMFEKWLNEELGSGPVKVHVAIVPVRRDLLLTYLVEGLGDVALGGITITAERQQLVDFTDPVSKVINEVIVAALDAPVLVDLDGLSGQQVHIRASSSYWESMEALNRELAARSLPPVDLVAADEYLSTEDLMQMANASLVPYTVADDSIARYWAQALPDVRVREDLAVRTGARTGWALRKDSPEFMALLNRFVAEHKQGTLIGNIVVNKYLKNPKRLHNVNSKEDRERLEAVIEYFETYAPEYEFDLLMMVAQGFQESRLDQSRKSHRGAMGVMQLLPSTAADPAVGVPDISTADNNILAGIRYMAHLRDTYLDDPALDELNRTLFAFASYNAGPNRVRTLRRTAGERGLDPNKWFDNVELIAGEVIGRETVEYVSNIYKYYLAYSLSQHMRDATGR